MSSEREKYMNAKDLGVFDGTFERWLDIRGGGYGPTPTDKDETIRTQAEEIERLRGHWKDASEARDLVDEENQDLQDGLERLRSHRKGTCSRPGCPKEATKTFIVSYGENDERKYPRCDNHPPGSYGRIVRTEALGDPVAG